VIHCLNSRQKMIACIWLFGLFVAPMLACSILDAFCRALGQSPDNYSYGQLLPLVMWGGGLVWTVCKRNEWEWVDKVITAIAATVSSGAKGKVQLWMAENEVIDDWASFRGRKGTKKTMASLIDFLQLQYGFDMSSAPRLNGELSPEQSRKVTRMVANMLIDAGVFTFNEVTPQVRDPVQHDAAAQEVRALREQQADQARRGEHHQRKAAEAQRSADFDRQLKIKRLKENYAYAVSQENLFAGWVAKGDKSANYSLSRAREARAKIEAELMAM